MRGDQYLTKQKQFDYVFTTGKTWTNRRIVMKAASNGLEITRYGFSVSRRIGKAVIRNRVKRRLREILRESGLRGGWDIVFIARTPVTQTDFQGLKISVADTLHRAGILEQADESDSSGNDQAVSE